MNKLYLLPTPPVTLWASTAGSAHGEERGVIPAKAALDELEVDTSSLDGLSVSNFRKLRIVCVLQVWLLVCMGGRVRRRRCGRLQRSAHGRYAWRAAFSTSPCLLRSRLV